MFRVTKTRGKNKRGNIGKLIGLKDHFWVNKNSSLELG
jgi:hypothetical protein